MRSLMLCPALLVGLILFAEERLSAQVFQFTGGTSSDLGQGGGLSVRGKGYEAWAGAGVADGHIIFGGYAKAVFHGYTGRLGDDDIPLTLPIDIFGTQETLHTLGLTLEKRIRQTTVLGFAGQMGTAYNTSMFSAGTSSGPVTGILFTDTRLTPDLHLFSKNILCASPTSISGVVWKPHGSPSSRLAAFLPFRGLIVDENYGYSLSFASGVGSGHAYTSEAFSLTQPSLELKLAQVNAADGFQRSLAGTPLQAELNGANITGTVHLSNTSSLGFGHQNFLVPQTGSQGTLHTQVDNLTGNWRLWDSGGPSFGAGFFRSTMPTSTTRGASLWAEQTLGPIGLRFNYLVSGSTSNPTVQSYSVTTQEKLSPRLSVLQVTSYSAGRTSVSFGGNLLTNLFTVGVNYQTLYVPVRPNNPFTQALTVSVKINLAGNIRLNTATSFNSQGKMIYTIAGSDSYYRLSGLEAAPQMQGFRLQQYVIQGLVTTPDGLPIYGAAIHIGKDVLYSDREGQFTARESKPGPYKIEIALDEFLANGTFTVVSAPESVLATKDESAPAIHIVLARS
jgi:hypothetical protein